MLKGHEPQENMEAHLRPEVSGEQRGSEPNAEDLWEGEILSIIAGDSLALHAQPRSRITARGSSRTR